MRGFFLFFCLIFIPGYSVQQESISLRSKGEPPKLLQHRIQQKLLVSDVSNPWISSASPFRDSPYDAEKTLDGDDIEGMNEEDTGITLTVDDRTFDVINANMGSFVKGAAKDVRGIVDGAANFVHNSIKKTLAPKQRPQKPSKPQKGGSIFDLFGLLPGKNGGNDYNAGNGNKDVSSMINSNYGVPQAPPIVSTTPTPSPNYGIPQAPVIGMKIHRKQQQGNVMYLFTFFRHSNDAITAQFKLWHSTSSSFDIESSTASKFKLWNSSSSSNFTEFRQYCSSSGRQFR